MILKSQSVFSEDYLLTNEFKLPKKNNEGTYFMKINSTSISLILELIKEAKWKKTN